MYIQDKLVACINPSWIAAVVVHCQEAAKGFPLLRGGFLRNPRKSKPRGKLFTRRKLFDLISLLVNCICC